MFVIRRIVAIDISCRKSRPTRSLTAKSPPFNSYPGGAPQWELLLDRALAENDD
jgi:hypothetical protein